MRFTRANLEGASNIAGLAGVSLDALDEPAAVGGVEDEVIVRASTTRGTDNTDKLYT